MIYVVFFVLIPGVPLLLTRHFAVSWFISSVIGILVLWGRMVYLESHAADSDFDVVFFMALLMWAIVQTIFYAIEFFIAYGVFKAVYLAYNRVLVCYHEVD